MTIYSEATELMVSWRSAIAVLDAKPYPTNQDYAIEQRRYDALVDFVEANGLNYSKCDPRGPA